MTEEPSTFCELAHFILEGLREGELWAGWAEDGRPAFGDTDAAPPENVTVEHAAEELAILAGVMAMTATQEAKVSRPSGGNRAERRAAAKKDRRRSV